ncbi:MAG: peptide deformylase [Ascidiaceihabitans sp.]|nr:peptide deformylase [Ascidiaceihabitans sp.]
MTVRPFLSWPDKRLRTAVPEVAEITDELRLIWADMVETMDAMPGVGLAAPQIGVMMQLAVVDASPDRKQRILLANPTILSTSEEKNTHDEASPNLPGVSAIIKRPKNVSVRYLNEDGVITRGDFTGLEATSVQHQIDHLQGKMYFDNLGRVKRDMLLRKARKT